MIIINGTRNVKGKFQNIFITVEVNTEPIKFVHTAPFGLSGQALQDFADSHEEQYRKDILADMEAGRTEFKHPDIFLATGTEQDNLKAVAKDLVGNLTYDNINNHIDTVFNNLNTVQKNSLKKLYKVVLYLTKK